MTVHTALLQGTQLLEDARNRGAPAHRGSAARRTRCSVERVYLYAHPEQELSEAGVAPLRPLPARAAEAASRRSTSPGARSSTAANFRVTPDVLIPRPETEHVVEVALEVARGARRVLDVGSGFGRPRGHAATGDWAPRHGRRTFRRPRALWLRTTPPASSAPVDLVVCDLMEAIAAGIDGPDRLQPPVRAVAHREGLQREVRDFEPHVALFAGQTGFELYDRIVADAPRVLRPGGWLIMELGFTSLDHVQALLAGWDSRARGPRPGRHSARNRRTRGVNHPW